VAGGMPIFFGGSTQWKRVLGGFPHNGTMFPEFFHTMEAGFEAGFHGVENDKNTWFFIQTHY
jgi:hypothetical protein